MKISVFTGRIRDIMSNERIEHVYAAVAIAASHHADLLVLPGNSFSESEGNLPDAQFLADTSLVPIVTEEGPHFYFICSGEMPHRFLSQQFSNSSKDPAVPDSATPNRVSTVLDALTTSDRQITLDKKRISLLSCGENNLLESHRSGNATLKYPTLGWPEAYDILLNPSHTPLRRAWVLSSRLEFFSKGGRTAIYCTNAITFWKNALFIYQDGKLVADAYGLHDDTGSSSFFGGEAWRLVTIDTP